MAQKIVNTKQAFGLEGEFYDASVRRALPRTAKTDIGFGKVAFLASDGSGVTATYNASTASKVAGVAVFPKEHINTNGDLSASFVAKAGKKVAIADLGRVIVKAANDAKVGHKVYTCVTAGTATGTATHNFAVGDIAGGTAAPASSAATGGVFVEVTGAMFDVVDANAGEPAVITLG